MSTDGAPEKTSELAQLQADYMREHFARMRQIDAKAVQLTTGLGVFNARQIFHLSNAMAHPSAQLPVGEINQLTALIAGIAEGSDDD